MPSKKPYSITKVLDKISPAKLLPALPQSLEPLLPAAWQNLFPVAQQLEKAQALEDAPMQAVPPHTEPVLASPLPLGIMLRQGAFDMDTSFNLALFSALGYTGAKSAYGVAATMRNLAAGSIPTRYGKRGSINAAFIASPLAQDLQKVPCSELFLPTLYSLESQLAVQAHIASNSHTAVLFFQGTENVLNIILDSALTPLTDTERLRSFQALLETGRPIAENLLTQLHLGLEPAQINSFFAHKHAIASYLMQPELQGLHMGFGILMGAFMHSASFQSMLATHNLAEKRIFCTGHSLGGALAVLMANTIQPFCAQPVHIYTYGCPRLGEADFVARLHPSLVHYRLLNNNDPVPWMPDLPAWRAHGQAFWFTHGADGNAALHACQPEFSLGRGPFAALQVNPLDHPLNAYVNALKQLEHIQKLL